MKKQVWHMAAIYFGGAALVAAGFAYQFGLGYGMIVFGLAAIAEVVIP